MENTNFDPVIKNLTNNKIILATLWKTYAKTEGLIRLCAHIGLNVEPNTKKNEMLPDTNFADLYAIQDSVVNGFIAMSDLSIMDDTATEKVSETLMTLFDDYFDYDVMSDDMIEIFKNKGVNLKVTGEVKC